MGILGEIGKVWSLGRRTLHELKTVAREAFRLQNPARFLAASCDLGSNLNDTVQGDWLPDSLFLEDVLDGTNLFDEGEQNAMRVVDAVG